MPQVISASRRTDVPGFYSEWFVNRLKEGFVYVRQPYNRKILRVSLRPEDVSAVFFCSKNYEPLLHRLEQIEKTTRNIFFHFTITANRELEFNTPDFRDAARDYLYLAGRYSPDHIIWRYDPVCVTDKLSFESHLDRFVQVAELLKGKVSRCIFSFFHPYKKALANFRKYTDHTPVELPPEIRQDYARRLSETAEQYGIRLHACCNNDLLSDRIQKANCIDGRYLSGLFDVALDNRHAATRKECGCTRSMDIGDYDTCAHGCVYCYANADKDKAASMQARHHPEWNSLRMNVDEKSMPRQSVHQGMFLF